jgi:hypothetical protein
VAILEGYTLKKQRLTGDRHVGASPIYHEVVISSRGTAIYLWLEEYTNVPGAEHWEQSFRRHNVNRANRLVLAAGCSY